MLQMVVLWKIYVLGKSTAIIGMERVRGKVQIVYLEQYIEGNNSVL